MANGYGPPDPWRLGGNWGPHRVPSLLSPSSIDEEEWERRLREMEFARMQAEARGQRVPANYRPTTAQPSLLQDALEAQSQRQSFTLGDWQQQERARQQAQRLADARTTMQRKAYIPAPRGVPEGAEVVDGRVAPIRRESEGLLSDLAQGVVGGVKEGYLHGAGTMWNLLGKLPGATEAEQERYDRLATGSRRQARESAGGRPETTAAKTGQIIADVGLLAGTYGGSRKLTERVAQSLLKHVPRIGRRAVFGKDAGRLLGPDTTFQTLYPTLNLGQKAAANVAVGTIMGAGKFLAPATKVGRGLRNIAAFAPMDILLASDPENVGFAPMVDAILGTDVNSSWWKRAVANLGGTAAMEALIGIAPAAWKALIREGEVPPGARQRKETLKEQFSLPAGETPTGLLAKPAEPPRYPLAPPAARQQRPDGGLMVTMTPDEFIAANKPLQLDEESLETIAELRSHIEGGGELDPVMFYDQALPSGQLGDGRHRAYAARELGIEEIPVQDFRPQETAGLLEAPVKPKVVKDAVIRQTPSQWGVERPEMQSALEPYPTVQYSTDPESIEYLLHSPVPPESSSLAGNYTSPVIRAVQGGPKSATLEGWEDYLTRQKGLKRDEVDLVLSALPYHQSGPTATKAVRLTSQLRPQLDPNWPRSRVIPRENVEAGIRDMYGGLKVVEADAKMLGGALGAHMRDVKPLERYIDEIKASPEYRAGTRWSQGSYSDVPDNLEDAVRLEAENLRQADLDRMRNNLREASDEYSISIGNQPKGWLDEGGEPFTPYAFEITSDLPGIRDYDKSHFGNPGAIAHVRFRRTPQGVGKRRADGLHPSSIVVDEIQSDVYQRLRQAAIHQNYMDRLKEEADRRFLDETDWALSDQWPRWGYSSRRTRTGDAPGSDRISGTMANLKNDVAAKWMEEAGLGKNPQLTRKNKDKLRQHVWKNTPQEVRRSVEDIVAQRSFGVDAAQLPFRQTEQWLRVAVSETLKRAAQNGIREVVFPTGTQINRVYQGESTNPGGMYDTVLQTVIKQVSKDLGATVKRMDLDQAEKYLPSDMADTPQGLLAGKHGPDIGADPDPNTVVEISEDLGSRMRGEQPHRPVSTKMYGGAGVDIAGLLGTTVEDDDPEEFGWRDVPSLLGAAALGRRAVATTGAGRTATARGQTVSAPMRRVIDKKLVRPNERVGHFGVGRAVGDMEAFPDAINIEKDAGLRAWIKEEAPKEFPDFKADVFASAEEAGAIGKLDVTLSPYVVNTLRDNVAVDHIVEMARSLNPDGRMLIWMRGKELKALSIGKGKEPGEWTLTGPEGSGQGQQWRDVADVEELVDAAARKSGHPLHITDVLEDTSGTLMVEVQRISQSPVPPKGIYGKSPQAKGVKASEYQPPDARTVAKRKKDTREFLDWAEKNPQGIWVPAERGVFDRSLITPGEYSRPGVNTLPPISPRSTASAKEGGLLRQISSGSMRGLLDRQAKLGLRQGGETFYNLLPVEAFIESIGRPKNSFRDFVAATSVSSSQNPVLREIASASILLYSKANNISVPQAMAEYLRRYPEAKGFDRQFLSGWKTDTPKGGSHVDKWNKYLETGSVDPPGPASGSRKTPTYFRQKLGEEIPGSTSDVHDQKAILWPTGNEWFIENVTGGRYGLLSDVSVAGGQRLGINPEQYQAGRWIGGGPLTGLGSARGDYVQHLEDALLWTAIMAGKDTSPQGLRKLFEGVINGREFILPYYGKGSPVTRGGSLIKSLSGLGGIAAIWAQQKEAAEES